MTNVNRALLAVLIAWFTLAASAYGQSSRDADTGPSEDITQEAADLMRALQNYGAKQRDKAVETTQEALANIDDRIDDLQDRLDRNWDRMSKAAREQARQSMRAMQEQRTQVAEWYGGLKAASADAWDEVKQGFGKSMEALAQAWNAAYSDVTTDQ